VTPADLETIYAACDAEQAALTYVAGELRKTGTAALGSLAPLDHVHPWPLTREGKALQRRQIWVRDVCAAAYEHASRVLEAMR